MKEEIKEHFQKYWKAYIVGGVVLTAGVITTYILTKNLSVVISNSIGVIGDNNKLDISIDNSVTFKASGNSGNWIKSKTTGQVWPSQRACAKDLGVSSGSVVGGLKGLKPDVKGHILTKIIDGQTEYKMFA